MSTKVNKQLFLKIHNREGILYQGNAVSISSTNDKGKFDILIGHNNFITLVNEKLELVLESGEKKDIPIGPGVLRVEKDVVDVYLGMW